MVVPSLTCLVLGKLRFPTFCCPPLGLFLDRHCSLDWGNPTWEIVSSGSCAPPDSAKLWQDNVRTSLQHYKSRSDGQLGAAAGTANRIDWLTQDEAVHSAGMALNSPDIWPSGRTRGRQGQPRQVARPRYKHLKWGSGERPKEIQEAQKKIVHNFKMDYCTLLSQHT